MKKDEFNYYLPEELIAQHPLEKRDSSKLMVVNKDSLELEHKSFSDLIQYFKSGDVLVLNNTRVLPARLIGEKKGTNSRIELLLLQRIDKNSWETLVKPGKKAREGSTFTFGEGILTGEIKEVLENGNRIINFQYEGIFEEILDKLGEMPLPPYIKEVLEDKERYQTVYSKEEGSAAAPTAGLHFTEKLLKDIEEMGVNIAYLTLHVGIGTFRPVKVEVIEEHKMHSEYYCLSKETANIINEGKKRGSKIIAVGTTSCRTLETLGNEEGFVKEGSGYTDIFIYPGYKFKVVDNLITNFHLPESTLLMLVSTLASYDTIKNAYETAVEMKYRFFSFGDAMFIK